MSGVKSLSEYHSSWKANSPGTSAKPGNCGSVTLFLATCVPKSEIFRRGLEDEWSVRCARDWPFKAVRRLVGRAAEDEPQTRGRAHGPLGRDGICDGRVGSAVERAPADSLI